METSITSRSRSRRSSVRAMLAHLWRALAVAGAAVVLASTAILFTRSGIFHVRTVEVHGATHLGRGEVIQMSGIARSDNAVWLDERAAEASLMRSPWIARAVVHVDLPWTVTITVTERSPIAVLERGAAEVLVAADGTLLGPAARADLPVIVAPPTWIADPSLAPVEGIARALRALAPEVRAAVRRIEVGSPSGLELFLSDGVRIAYGSPRGVEAKAEAIGDVLAWVDATGERIRSMNVSAPSAPAILPTS